MGFGMLASFLPIRKSKLEKVGAFLRFPELLTKLLMPKSAKKAIEELKKKENESE